MSGLSIRRYEPRDSERVHELHEKTMRKEGTYIEDIPDTDLDHKIDELLAS
ncbi:hypothetical protein SAMN05421858_4603 [Haladaptatus litoreus]|uniref:GNAT family N-acetyltransferase n=1 Tax=Haladaptatus litoreus TaxID=553468 RepID=A0A1N7EXB7_9EURY|nr:hypothetical protein SAMN05421858_4603 [Haladaptatus litoreus]